MAKNKIFAMIMALMLMVIPGAFAVETQEVEAGLTPDSPFYFLDKWGEGLSLAFTFNDEGKAVKHLEFAQERLSEMQEIEDIEEIEDLQLNYAKNLQKSKEKTKSKDFSETIDKFESKNKQVLEELREKLPEEAQKGIENAIENSQKAKSYTEEEKVQNRIANQDMMMEKFLEEFEGSTFHIKIKTNEDVNGIKMYAHSYYLIENGELKQTLLEEDADYTINVEDSEKAKELYQKYESGEVITYNEVTDVFDVPLRLQGKLVSIVGIGGLN